jgi:hypothetical protein
MCILRSSHAFSLYLATTFSIDCSSVFKLTRWKKKEEKEIEKERMELTKRSNRIDKQICIRHSLLLLSIAFNLNYFIDRNATSTIIFTAENCSCYLSLDRWEMNFYVKHISFLKIWLFLLFNYFKFMYTIKWTNNMYASHKLDLSVLSLSRCRSLNNKKFI